MILDSEEPIDPAERLELMLAKLMALLHNVHRDPKHTPVATVEDYLPTWLRPEKQPKTSDELFAMVVAINEAMGGRDLRKGPPN